MRKRTTTPTTNRRTITKTTTTSSRRRTRTRQASAKLLPNELFNLEATVLYGILATGEVTSGQILIHDRNEIAPYELDLLITISNDVRIGVEVQDLNTHIKYNEFKATKCAAHGIIYCEVWEDDIENGVKKVNEKILEAKALAQRINELSRLNYLGEYNNHNPENNNSNSSDANKDNGSKTKKSTTKTATKTTSRRRATTTKTTTRTRTTKAPKK